MKFVTASRLTRPPSGDTFTHCQQICPALLPERNMIQSSASSPGQPPAAPHRTLRAMAIGFLGSGLLVGAFVAVAQMPPDGATGSGTSAYGSTTCKPKKCQTVTVTTTQPGTTSTVTSTVTQPGTTSTVTSTVTQPGTTSTVTQPGTTSTVTNTLTSTVTATVTTIFISTTTTTLTIPGP